MQEIITIKNYAEFEQKFDTVMLETAEKFVVIGFMLKVARDTDILKESGYSSMGEFAQKRYGLTKDIASRYIAINDKYSENGYSEKLNEKYSAFGFTKLAEMLTLPEVVADEIGPEMTREDIRAIKAEINEENKISDIEVILEEKDQGAEAQEGTLAKVLYQICHENPEIFERLWVAVKEKSSEIECLMDSLSPSGVAMISCRIPGSERLMLKIMGIDENPKVIKVRSNEKEEFTWEELQQVAVRLCEGLYGSWREAWEEKYSEKLPEEKPEVAPAQLKAERVVKAKPKKPEKPKAEEKPKMQDHELVPEEQLPGQMEVGDFPDMLPTMGQVIESIERDAYKGVLERDECEHEDAGTNGNTGNAEGSDECIPEDLGTGEPEGTGNREPEPETPKGNEESSRKESYEEIKGDIESTTCLIYDGMHAWREKVPMEELEVSLRNAKRIVQMIEQLMEITEEE